MKVLTKLLEFLKQWIIKLTGKNLDDIRKYTNMPPIVIKCDSDYDNMIIADVIPLTSDEDDKDDLIPVSVIEIKDGEIVNKETLDIYEFIEKYKDDLKGIYSKVVETFSNNQDEKTKSSSE